MRALALLLSLSCLASCTPCTPQDPLCDDDSQCAFITYVCGGGVDDGRSENHTRRCVSGRCENSVADARAYCSPNKVTSITSTRMNSEVLVCE